MGQPAGATARKYTYKDYLSWPEDERWELWSGEPVAMVPAPGTAHQIVVGELLRQVANFLTDRDCQVFVAPFDVRLPDGEEPDEEVTTVVQPDIAVICDPAKIDARGARGAPDLIIEVISPATAVRDQIHKVVLYEKHGVKEYWLIHPTDRVVIIRRLGPDGRYSPPAFYEASGRLPVEVLPGLDLDLDAAFRRLSPAAV